MKPALESWVMFWMSAFMLLSFVTADILLLALSIFESRVSRLYGDNGVIVDFNSPFSVVSLE